MRKAFDGKEYGFFFHFLNNDDRPVGDAVPDARAAAAWNRKVDSFDTETFADQLCELNAGYVFLTVGQNSGYCCVPNRLYSETAGAGWCSERDLMADFAASLARRGIDCYAYTTTLAPAGSRAVSRALRSVPPWNSNQNFGNYETLRDLAVEDPRLREFMRLWAEIHREWSLRWGRSVKGWWVDGAYFSSLLFDHQDEPNGHSFCRALRAGNPDAVVAFNPGTMMRRNYPGSDEDYTAGETIDPMQLPPGSRIIDGLRYHVLSYAGQTWGGAPLRADARGFAVMTRNVTDQGGVMTWDLPFTVRGLAPEVFDVFRAFAREYRRSKEAFPPTAVTVTEHAVELKSDREFPVRMARRGAERIVSSNGVCPLEAGTGEERLLLTAGGFTRDVPLIFRKRLVLASGAPVPVAGTDFEGRLARDGEKLVFSGRVREAEPRAEETPWMGSGVVLFLSSAKRSLLQFVLRSDGVLFQLFPERIRFNGVFAEPAVGGYRFSFSVPLPDPERFLCEISTQIRRDGRLCTTHLLGGARSGFMMTSRYAEVTVKR